MATYPVKWIHSGMRGAPQVSGTAGTLLAALRAFLLNGFGQVTALSVSVSGGIATASLNAGQSFDKHAIVLVEGATPALLNGEARVLTATNSAITWATTAPDGAATGVITIKVAPVGHWAEVFTATNVSVFRSTDVAGARFYYRVDDTGTVSARVRGYLGMTDVDTGTGPFPTEAQIAGGGHICKSSVASAAGVPYVFAADSRTVLIAPSPRVPSNAAHTSAAIRGFGDMLPLATVGDAYSAAVSCATSGDASITGGATGGFDTTASGANAVYVARDASGLGDAVAVGTKSYIVGGISVSSGNDSSLGKFPSSIDGQLKYCRRYIFQNNAAADQPPRADVPGVLYIPQTNVLGPIGRLDIINGAGDFVGRMLLALTGAATTFNSVPVGISLLDITGPWR